MCLFRVVASARSSELHYDSIRFDAAGSYRMGLRLKRVTALIVPKQRSRSGFRAASHAKIVAELRPVAAHWAPALRIIQEFR